MLAAGSIFMLLVIVSLGGFIATYHSMPRFVWLAIVLDLMAIAALAALNAQIGLALNINYNQPVAVIQKRLETLRKFRVRYGEAICLTVALTWAPIVIVAMKGFLGLDVYRLFGTTWIFFSAILPARPERRIRISRDLAEFENDHSSSYSPQERSSMREYSPEE